ncbi:hypothetical protein [Methylibium sp. T29]|uniref:hypothetical protein n=1 Tax=Methylibium sp. T29 TaxID=1430884 RepID=UPI001C1DE6CE|nr:hypothetical protein [Methylibium sp. T29]
MGNLRLDDPVARREDPGSNLGEDGVTHLFQQVGSRRQRLHQDVGVGVSSRVHYRVMANPFNLVSTSALDALRPDDGRLRAVDAAGGGRVCAFH